MANGTNDGEEKVEVEATIIDGFVGGLSGCTFTNLINLIDNLRLRRASETIEEVKIFLQLALDEVVAEMASRSKSALTQRAAKKAAS